MRKIFIYFILLINLNVIAQIKYENDSILIWNKARKINWKDFQNKENISGYLDARAVIVPTISFFPNNINSSNIKDLKVVASINKNLSWVSFESVEGLNHEQGHFDITEIYARKVRKYLISFLNTNTKYDIITFVNFFDEIDEEHWQFQFLYEEETERGVNINKQNEWNKKISKLLDEFKEYELDIHIESFINSKPKKIDQK